MLLEGTAQASEEKRRSNCHPAAGKKECVNIVLLGASGFVGSKILQEALNRSHIVTAVSRAPEKLPKHANLRTAQSDVNDVAALTDHFRGQDAVIHSYAPPADPEARAFGRGFKHRVRFVSAPLQAGDQSKETVSYTPRDAAAHEAHVKSRIEAQTSGTRSIIDAAKAAGLKRILAVGGVGTLLVNGVRTMDRPEFPWAFEGGAKSTAVVKELLQREPGIDWTVLCPPMTIAPGQRTGKFRIGLDDLLIMPDGSSEISLEDFAMAMIDELEQPRHTGQRFTVGY
jgi:putative NADH-flavin reductase